MSIYSQTLIYEHIYTDTCEWNYMKTHIHLCKLVSFIVIGNEAVVMVIIIVVLLIVGHGCRRHRCIHLRPIAVTNLIVVVVVVVPRHPRY